MQLETSIWEVKLEKVKPVLKLDFQPADGQQFDAGSHCQVASYHNAG